VLDVCAEAYAPLGAALSTVIHAWVVGSALATNLRAVATKAAVNGGTASVGVGWNAAPGERYLGTVDILQVASGAVLGATTVFIDTTPGAATARPTAVLHLPEDDEGKRAR
jgi:hypothetical protein